MTKYSLDFSAIIRSYLFYYITYVITSEKALIFRIMNGNY